MKKLNIFASLLVGLALLTACESDRDDNPVLRVPTGATAMQMLAPEIGSNVVDLKHSEAIQLKVKQAPDYGGFPTQTSYWAEITEAADFSNPEKVFALDTKGRSITYDAPTNEIDLGIMKLRGYTSADEVDENEVITLNVRMVASLANATDASTNVYSDAQQIKVYAYYLKESLPAFWYMTGGIIADGSWANSLDAVGVGMVPMYVKTGEEYNRFTGDGTIEYVGYFPAGDFKIIAPKGLENWNFGICEGNLVDGGFRYRSDGDEPSGNINVPEAGYYRLTLNTESHELKSEKLDESTIMGMTPNETETFPVYETMKVGDFDMAPVTVAANTGGENHDWFATITVAAETKVRFTSGSMLWGTDGFPYGISTSGGAEITVLPATYKVYFNDITGAFMFVEQDAN